MKIRLLFLLALSSFAFGQGTIVPPQTAFKVVNGVTSPIANATITVCAAQTPGVPCSPVLSNALFQDAALTEPLENPFTADSTGNYQFAIAAGTYTVTVSAAGFSGYSYQITVGGSGGSSGGGGSTGGGSGPVLETIPNCPIGGTVLNGPAQLSSQTVNGVLTACVIGTPVGSTSAIGLLAAGSGTSGNASIAYQGFSQCVFTGQTQINDIAVPSTTVANQCDDVGAFRIAGVQSLGRISSVNTGSGTLATVNLFTGDVVGAGSSGGNGTVNNGPQSACPFYSSPGSNNQISPDANCVTDGAGNFAGFKSIVVGTPGQLGAITMGNGMPPGKPTSGASTVFTGTGATGFLGCIDGSGNSCAGTSIDVRVGYGGSGGVDCSGVTDSTTKLQTMINNAPDFSKFVFPANCKVLVSTTGGSPTAITIQGRYGLEFWSEGRNTNGCDTGSVGPGGMRIVDTSSYVAGAKIFYINQSQRLLFHNLVIDESGAVDTVFDVDQTTSPPITTQNVWENTCVLNRTTSQMSTFNGWRFSNTAANNVEAQWLYRPYVQCSSSQATSASSNGNAILFGGNVNQKDEIVDGLVSFGCSVDVNAQNGTDFTFPNWLMSNSWTNLVDGLNNSWLSGIRTENATNAINIQNAFGVHTYFHNDFAAAAGSQINCVTNGCGSVVLIGNNADAQSDWFSPGTNGQNSTLVGFGNRNISYNQYDFQAGMFTTPITGACNLCMVTNTFGTYMTSPMKATPTSGTNQNNQSPLMIFEGVYGASNLLDTWAMQSIPNGPYGNITNSTFELEPTATSGSITRWLALPAQLGGLTLAPLSTPGTGTATAGGVGTGATTYTYKVVAHGNVGTTVASSTFSCSNCVATLSGTSYALLTFPSTAGATSYDIYRTACGGSGVCGTNPTGKIGSLSGVILQHWLKSAASIVSFQDTGLSGDATSSPAVNNTGYLAGTELATPASNPAAGTELGYFKAGSGWCSFDSSGIEHCPGSSTAPTPNNSSQYTVYPATNSGCAIYSLSGTTYCALNNSTNSVQFNSTDIRVLWDDIVGANVNGGYVFFKNGTYNCNSLDQESTGGFTNFYCIGIPGNVAANQFTSWTLRGESLTPVVGLSPVQTSGTIINLTSTAIGSVAANSKIMVIWSRPPTGSGAIGPEVFEENLDIRVPTNQRGCETESDLSQAVNSSYINVTADTAVQPSSLAFPVQASCVAWGGTDPGGLIGLVTTNAGENVQYMNNVNAWGSDVCLDIRGEHNVLINAFGDTCNHAIDFGVRGPNMFHSSVIIAGGWQESRRGLTIGGSVQPGVNLDAYALDIEDATSGSFTPIYHAVETNSGRTYGTFTFQVVAGGTGAAINLPSLFDDATNPGEGKNILQNGVSPNVYLPSTSVFTDNFTRANSTTLGAGWTAGSNISISSNTAVNTATGAGVSEFWGSTFSTDQFAQMTISSMNVNAATYAQIAVNQTGSDLGSNRVDYEYFCSRSAGAGQYGLGKHSGGSQTNFVTSSTAACPTPPFTMEIRHQGSLICAYMNGVLDTNLGTGCAIDSALSGGVPSIDLIGSGAAVIAASNFVGGSLPPLHGTVDSIFGQQNGWSGLQRFTTMGTTTNCAAIGSAANPSVAACGAASAGTVSCATNASTGTCTVNTTAVTANSQIFLTQRADTTTGTRLGVTCNTTKDSNSTSPQITAVTAATSFTFQLGTVATNPECFSYQIIN